MSVEEYIRSLSPHEKLEAFQILQSELAAEEPEIVAPAWHADVLAQRRANPDPGPSLPIEEAFDEILAEYHARQTSEEARKDISAGANFYRNQSPGVGEYFIESIRADITDLKWQAGIHAKLNGYHCKRAKKFPYGIYYAVENGIAEVVAILDLRGHPEALQRRIEQREHRE